MLIFIQQSTDGFNRSSALTGCWMGPPPQPNTCSFIHLIHEKGAYWLWEEGVDFGLRPKKEEDRVEGKPINTQGGKQVLQTNVIYRVHVPYSADR